MQQPIISITLERNTDGEAVKRPAHPTSDASHSKTLRAFIDPTKTEIKTTDDGAEAETLEGYVRRLIREEVRAAGVQARDTRRALGLR